MFVTKRGNEKQGVITGFSMNDGAEILFSVGDTFTEGSFAYAANTEHGSSDEKNCYYHPEDPDWGDEIDG